MSETCEGPCDAFINSIKHTCWAQQLDNYVSFQTAQHYVNAMEGIENTVEPQTEDEAISLFYPPVRKHNWVDTAAISGIQQCTLMDYWYFDSRDKRELEKRRVYTLGIVLARVLPNGSWTYVSRRAR